MSSEQRNDTATSALILKESDAEVSGPTTQVGDLTRNVTGCAENVRRPTG